MFTEIPNFIQLDSCFPQIMLNGTNVHYSCTLVFVLILILKKNEEKKSNEGCQRLWHHGEEMLRLMCQQGL